MIELTVTGMSCNHCTAAITRAIQAIDAQANVETDVATQRVRVQSTAAPEAIKLAVEDAGYAVLAEKSA